MKRTTLTFVPRPGAWAAGIGILAGALALATMTAAAQTVSPNPPPPLTGTITYTVQVGDVLDLIAANYDVQVACIVQTNNLSNPALIFPGDALTISDTCPPYDGASFVANPRDLDPGQGGGGDRTIFIRPGDTVETIGRQYDVSLQAILVANGLNLSSILRSGDTLILPGNAPAFGLFPALIGSPADGQGGGGTYYVVQPRDALDLIAAFYNVDLACLAQGNTLSNPGFILPGLVLAIPQECPPYRGLSTPPTALRGAGVMPVLGGTGGGDTAPTQVVQPTTVVTTTIPPIGLTLTSLLAPRTAIPTTAIPPTAIQPTLPPDVIPPTAIPPTAPPDVIPPTVDPNVTAPPVTRGPTITPTAAATMVIVTATLAPATPNPTPTQEVLTIPTVTP